MRPRGAFSSSAIRSLSGRARSSLRFFPACTSKIAMYAENTTSRTSPSYHAREFPHQPSPTSKTLAMIKTGRSSFSDSFCTGKKCMRAESPKMSSILAILLPTTLPIAMSVECPIADVTETASSGILVPNATTVSPMTSGEILHFFAIPALPSTNQSAPFTSRTSPTIKRKICNANICIFFFCKQPKTAEILNRSGCFYHRLLVFPAAVFVFLTASARATLRLPFHLIFQHFGTICR